MPAFARWTLGILLATFLFTAPFVYYRASYTQGKRLRVVAPGKVYRSGQMTVEGFAQTIAELGIRTVINAQDQYPDPEIEQSYFDHRSLTESELCRRMGVRYVFLPPDLIPRRRIPDERPAAIDKFLAIMDNPANYPVLIHCRAGLHRTGCLVAIYRMEYDGWSADAAVQELKANGFGEWACEASNDYITQYILAYCPGVRKHFVSGVSGQ
jgi:tyrosine-protein phosphatase SIW14